MKLKKLTRLDELRHDMILLSVDLGGNESLERVTCIDNGMIWTYGLADNLETFGESLDTYFSDYSDIYEVVY